MHENIDRLSNKAANLYLYDQTHYHWMLATQTVVIHEKQKRFGGTQEAQQSDEEHNPWCTQRSESPKVLCCF